MRLITLDALNQTHTSIHPSPLGPSIKYVTLFLANFDPLPLSHFFTHPGTPRKYVTHLGPLSFLVDLVQEAGQEPPVQIISQLFTGLFVRGVLSGGLLSGRFWPGWLLSVPVLSEYIRYNRKLNITLNFMFRMYDNFFYKCDITCSLPPSPPCHKVSHLLGPPRA